jgi:hypothetical protein
MRRQQKFLVITGFIVVVAVLVGLTTVLGGSFLRRETEDTLPGKCQNIGRTYNVIIQGGAAQPTHIDAHVCDQLTIQNLDTKTRLIGFGNHSQHVAYNGVAERMLKTGQSMNLVLNQVGSYHFHDHYQSELEVTFTVQQ